MKLLTLLSFITLVGAGCVDVEPPVSGDSWGFSEPSEMQPAADPCADGPCQEPAPAPNPAPDPAPDPGPEPTEPQPQPAPGALLDGAFVSGHLGSYQACPEEGLRGPSDGDGDGVSDDAFCADPDGQSCGACEHGVMLIQVASVGALSAFDVGVVSLDLYDGEGELRAELPILEVVAFDTGEAFGGELPPGPEQLVRIRFRGPSNPAEFLTPLDADSLAYPLPGVIHVDVGSSNAPTLTVISTELSPIPDVDT